jgi:CheY-like chemotaxis protein
LTGRGPSGTLAALVRALGEARRQGEDPVSDMAGTGPTSKGRILVIDDSELVLEITRDALEEAGYEVLTNSSWMEVNATIRERKPDMILLDLMMPSMKGESLCEILKKSSFGREIPIIIFSTKEESEIQRLAEDAGADGYIVKRMNRKDIVESVEHFFQKLVRE